MELFKLMQFESNRRVSRRKMREHFRRGPGSADTATYGGLNSNSGPSPGLWGDCNITAIREGKDTAWDGRFDWLDFRRIKPSSNVNAATAYWDQGMACFGSNGASIVALDAQGSGMTISSDGDDEGISFQTVTAPYKISRATKAFWFEARVRVSTIADTKFGLFTGMAELLTLGATVPIAAAGTIADQNLVGWHRLEGDGDQFDFIYKANGVTQVTVRSDAFSGGISADTWYKLGFKYSQFDKGGQYLLVPYINGVRYTTTAGLVGYTMASADGTDFPNDVQLAPVIALLNATGTTPGSAVVSDIWAAQLFV